MVVWVLALVAVASALPFEAHINTPSSLLKADMPFEVYFSLTNTDEKPLTICRWGTPLDENSRVFRANMFNIVTELGVSPMYSGILMKRRLAYEDVLTLQPGETVNATVDLQNGYWFNQQGKFFVNLQTYLYTYPGEFDGNVIYNGGINNFDLYELTSAEILPITVLEPNTQQPIFMQKSPSGDSSGRLGSVLATNGCPSANVSTINTADTNARTLSSRVVSFVSGSCPGGKYTTWMGACDSSRYSTVQRNVNNINNRIGNGYRVDCAGKDCRANVFAYVYPSDASFWVYVCGAFWSAGVGTCVTDSKPGTINHEISHFTPVAGTGDYAYGQTACRNLATSNPGEAIRNADNYEYLAESCPP